MKHCSVLLGLVFICYGVLYQGDSVYERTLALTTAMHEGFPGAMFLSNLKHVHPRARASGAVAARDRLSNVCQCLRAHWIHRGLGALYWYMQHIY